MRDFFGGLILLASLAVFFISLFALIKPLPKLKLPNRKTAALALLGSFVMFGIGGAIIPKVETEGTSAADASTPAPAKVAAKVDLTGEVNAVWTQITDSVAACDAASVEVAEAFDKTRDMYALYSTVTSAQKDCKAAWSGLNSVKPPESAKGAEEKGFREAITTCSTAYFMKAEGYENMAKVLDGDMRPSAVATAKESMETATGAQLYCVTGFYGAAEKAGVSMADIGEKKAG